MEMKHAREQLACSLKQRTPASREGRLFLCFGLCLVLGLSACDSGQDAGSASDARTAQQPDSTSSAPAPGATGEPDGLITANFNGTKRTWYITSSEREGHYMSQSDWSPSFASYASISLFGHTQSGSTFQSAEAIMIGFTLQGRGENPSVSEPSITYLSGGIMNNHSSSHGGEASVEVNNAEFEGDTLKISGTFSGTLPFKSLAGSSTAPGDEVITVKDGTFEGTVRQLQDH
jgi:hypothetical protein